MTGRSPMGKTALAWAAASAGLMIVGAIGPWVALPSGLASVGGLDGANDGWFVVVVAGIALVILAAFLFGSSTRVAWLIPVLAFLGLVVAALDRHDVISYRESTVGDLFSDDDKPSGDAVYEVGWGLNLAMGAAFSLLLASLVLLVAKQKEPQADADANVEHAP